MSKKKLLAINLNEFNLSFLNWGAEKYNCSNIKKFLKLRKIKTFSSDKIQDKDLDPWVQNISMNTGKQSREHKIFNLGEKILNITQIWDVLSKRKITCSIWGPMNTKFQDSQFIKIFLPDPWNNQTNLKPSELRSLYRCARSYAQNYTNYSILKNINNFIKLFIYLIKKNIFFKLIIYLPVYLKILITSGLRNYMLFFLFDILSLEILNKLINKNKYKSEFVLIFLNSLAHYQHNNWDEKKNHKNYFIFVNQIFSIIFDISKKFDSLIVYNGFSQKKIKTQYLLRPKDPRDFFRKLNVKFRKFHSNMTNGAILTFKSELDLKKNVKILKKISVLNYNIFEIKKLNKLEIFCRVQIRSFRKMNLGNINSPKKVYTKDIFYERKTRNKIAKNNIELEKFINQFIFIKTTSKHYHMGNLFYNNILIKNSKIENIKIYNLIYKFFFGAN